MNFIIVLFPRWCFVKTYTIFRPGTNFLTSIFFRFLETGLFADFNKIRMKLSELSSIQIHSLYKKSQNLERSVRCDVTMRPAFFPPEPRRPQMRRANMMPPIHPLTPIPPPQMFFPSVASNNFFHCSSHLR